MWPQLGKARRASNPRKNVWEAVSGESQRAAEDVATHPATALFENISETYRLQKKSVFWLKSVVLFDSRALRALSFLSENLIFKNLELFYNGRLPDFKGCPIFQNFRPNAFLENYDFGRVSFS